MPASDWVRHDIENRLRAILADANEHAEHHFGRAYLTAYQIAVAFEQRHPEVLEAMGLTVGGAGTGEPSSLAQYLARELSRRIKKGELPDIEGAFLADEGIRDMVFKRREEDLRSSLLGSNDLSMFRLRRQSFA